MQSSPNPAADRGTAISRRRALGLAGGAALAGTGLLAGTSPAARAATALKTPAIFYAPHQDDEALGYVGQILAHKAAGRPVFLVLVTQGQNVGLAQRMNQGACGSGPYGGPGPDLCVYPNAFHNLGWDKSGNKIDPNTPRVVKARTQEFTEAARILGVDKFFNWQLPEIDEELGQSFDSLRDAVFTKVRALEKKYPGSSHKFPAGWLDCQDTHKAISDAAYWLKDEVKDQRFTYGHIYGDSVSEACNGGKVTSKAWRDRVSADAIQRLSASDMKTKKAVIRAYNTYDPDRGLYATGFHSYAPGLLEAYNDPREWVYLMPSDYSPGPITGNPDKGPWCI
ncbi:PIG-L family deacetylase [Streptomyces sp. NBC_00249]|uniref:PIG-L family deacetylase n=1 Tax=Streptomyces sp. NBC_00249 TaxID=2975690 RepID=UPI002255BB1F|nr:PIG-L family deacetylase [Streptomyces sp. NBC_00249]